MKLQLFALPLIALGLAAAIPAAGAAEVQIVAQNPVIELSMIETINTAPDAAVINAGVQSRGATAVESMRINAEQMERVIARLLSLGVRREDIQTGGLSLNAQYQYGNDGEPPRFLGYDTSNNVTVNLRQMDRIGATLDALAQAGATNLNGPMFTLVNDAAVKDAARKAAFEKAQARALSYAQMAGFTGARLLEVSENAAGYSGVVPVVMSVDASAKSTTPIAQGQVGVGIQMMFKFEMTR